MQPGLGKSECFHQREQLPNSLLQLEVDQSVMRLLWYDMSAVVLQIRVCASVSFAVWRNTARTDPEKARGKSQAEGASGWRIPCCMVRR